MTHEDRTYIYGKHAVSEALQSAPYAVGKVFLAARFDDEPLQTLITKAGVPTTSFPAQGITGLEKDAVHQGIVAEVSLERLVRSYRDFTADLTVDNDTALVLLGEVQDPQNVGAIIRSAAAFGIKGVLIPEHNQAQVTGLVVKVSAGMAFRVPLVSVGNVNTAIRDLKERGFWVYGLDETSPQSVTKEIFDAPALFILGNEAKGIREKTRELCDILISIPMHPRCESLNAATAAAVTLYTWSAQHSKALAR